MKKIAILLVLFAPLLMGQDIIYTNSATIEWDAVMQLANGDPIPTDWILEYEVFLSDPETFIGIITETSIDIPVTWSSHRYIGIRSVMTEDDGVTIHRSDINWSNVNGAQTPDPFILCESQVPAAPLGLRIR